MFGLFKKFKFKKLYEVKSPSRGTKFSAGIDFYIPDYTEDYAKYLKGYIKKVSVKESNGKVHRYPRICIPPHGKILIPSGLKVSYPKNRALDFLNKSGIASRDSLIVGAELCDWDYMNELFFDIHNISDNEVYIDFGQKIIQGILIPVYYLKLKEVYTEKELFGKRSVTRKGGFGSTGLK